eukprot:TRINITY_DN147_c0_g1_i1.p1 TRINITY_DN147_c0_g1~~TRINITY_DN147_c0_g1_i1.p1  ORF type:complete len:418 (+),score=62.53 TRINITY_DN147_c0_g1_i1:277-1530(+)
MESVSRGTCGSFIHSHTRPSARGTLLYRDLQTKQQLASTKPIVSVPLGGSLPSAGVAVSQSAPHIFDPGMAPTSRPKWPLSPTSQVVHVNSIPPQRPARTYVKETLSSRVGVQHSSPCLFSREVSGKSGVPCSPSSSCVTRIAGALYPNGSDHGDSTSAGIGCSSSMRLMRDLPREFAAESVHKKNAERVVEELNEMQAQLSQARSQVVFAERAAELAKSQCQAEATAQLDQHALRTELIEALGKHEDRLETYCKAAERKAGELVEARAEVVSAHYQAQAIAEMSQKAADRNSRQLAEAMIEVAVARSRVANYLDMRQTAAESTVELAETRAELAEERRQARAMMEFHHAAVESNTKKIAQLQAELAASHHQSFACAEDAEQNAADSAETDVVYRVARDQAHARAVFHEKVAECVAV